MFAKLFNARYCDYYKEKEKVRHVCVVYFRDGSVRLWMILWPSYVVKKIKMLITLSLEKILWILFRNIVPLKLPTRLKIN